jgi:hypothetical protein
MEGCRPWKSRVENSTVPIPAKNHEVQLFLKEKLRESPVSLYTPTVELL